MGSIPPIAFLARRIRKVLALALESADLDDWCSRRDVSKRVVGLLVRAQRRLIQPTGYEVLVELLAGFFSDLRDRKKALEKSGADLETKRIQPSGSCVFWRYTAKP